MKRILIILSIAMFLVAPVYAAQPERVLMAQTITVPNRSYTPGTYEVVLGNLPGNSEGAEFIFTRQFLNTMTPGLVVAQVDFYTRINASDPWKHKQGLFLTGGPMFDKQGNLLTVSIASFTWEGVASPSGRIKIKGNDVKVIAQVFETFETAITINSHTRTSTGAQAGR